MKILILGSLNKWSIENQFSRNFIRLGHDVSVFEGQSIFHEYYYKSLWNKIMFRSGLSTIHKKIRKALFQHIGENQFDLILIFKGMEYSPKTISLLKTNCKLLANYNCDHPFDFEFRGSGNKNVLRSIQYYDYYFTYSKSIMKSLEDQYNVKSAWLPFGYDNDEISRLSSDNKKKEFCFIGNPDAHRADMITALAETSLPISLYGTNWSKYIDEDKYPNISIYPPVYQEEFYRTINSYGLHLNFFRKQNKDSHNMRTFEVPVTGSLLLTPMSIEQTEIYGDNAAGNILQFADKENFLQLAQESFARFEVLVGKERVMERRNFCISANSSYLQRSEEVIAVVSKYF